MLAIRTILYPTDLSGEGAEAFRLACSLARDYDARLLMMTVYDPPFNRAEAIDRTRTPEMEDDLLARMQAMTKGLEGISFDFRVEEGDAAEMILAVAEEVHADLIVMGTHGRSGVQRVVMGSVAEEVSRRATCPVATVRSGVPAISEVAPPFPVEAPGAIEDIEAGPEHWLVHSTPGDPQRDVTIPIGHTYLLGTLAWPDKPKGVIVFAHGSGSSRNSPRNQYVASELNQSGFATLLFDLLTDEEALDRDNVFDTDRLANRLCHAAEWVRQQPETQGIPVGYFGASTGSTASLIAAAMHPELVNAVVSRGGRTDLASDHLPAVQAATLLIVGEDDEPVLSWNRESYDQLTCVKDLAVIPGATHLFEEPGAMEHVAELAGRWFSEHLTRTPRRSVATATHLM